METFFVRRQLFIGAIVFGCLGLSLMVLKALAH